MTVDTLAARYPQITVTPRTVYRVECACGRTWIKNTPEEATTVMDTHANWHKERGRQW